MITWRVFHEEYVDIESRALPSLFFLFWFLQHHNSRVLELTILENLLITLLREISIRRPNTRASLGFGRSKATQWIFMNPEVCLSAEL